MKKGFTISLLVALLISGCGQSIQPTEKATSNAVELTGKDIDTLDKEYSFQTKALTAAYLKRKLVSFIGNDNGISNGVKIIKELEYARFKGEVVIPFKEMMADDPDFYTTLTGVTAVDTHRPHNPPFDLFISEADPNAPKAPDNVIYVNGSLTTGTGDGTSWENAYIGVLGLRDALNSATDGKQIWVAAGTYKPTDITGATGRVYTFQLKSGVNIYGGFAGTEKSLGQRTPDLNDYITILSGDLLGDDIENNLNSNKSDNSYHVVVGANNSILEGVTIKNGNASVNNTFGGGMFASGTQTLKNITFLDNKCRYRGAGLYAEGANLTLENVTFYNNRTQNVANSVGGGIYATYSTVNISNTSFINNYSDTEGGGAFLLNSLVNISNSFFKNNQTNFNGGGLNVNSALSSSVFENLVFDSNTAGRNGSGMFITSGGGFYNMSNLTFYNNNLHIYSHTSVTLKNSIIWGGSSPRISVGEYALLKLGNSIVEGGNIVNTLIKSSYGGKIQTLDGVEIGASNFTTAGNNLTDDPKFISSENLALQSDSPAINAGTNDGAPETDIIGTTRPQGAATDIGAYEFIE